MTHEDAFLADILDHRDEDAPRLVYADWLLDRGDPASVARGEFIHLQCALARLPEGAPRPADLLARERDLLEANRREWGSVFQKLGCRCWEYRRGFVEGVGMPAPDFLAQAANLFRQSPLRQLKLYDTGSVAGVLASCPYLAHIQILDLEANGLGDLEVQLLAASPHLSAIVTLLLWSNRIGNVGAQSLAGSLHLRRLALLDLGSNQIGDPGATALARSPHAGGLALLDLGKNPIGAIAQAVLRERFAGRVHVWG
jgi:uncharacterized protein (TIGR02996 family)